jgi:hypothetical protein
MNRRETEIRGVRRWGVGKKEGEGAYRPRSERPSRIEDSGHGIPNKGVSQSSAMQFGSRRPEEMWGKR